MRPTSKDPAFYVDPSRMIGCRKIEDTLEAHVIGTDTYRLKISIRGKRTGRTSCSCPAFSNYGSCKHIAAVLIAYEKHPEWFRETKGIAKQLQDLPREKLEKMLEMLFDSIPQARDFIESDLSDPSQGGNTYRRKIRKLFASCSMIDGSVEALYLQLDAFFARARRFYEEKSHLLCLQLCYEIVQGCLALDDEWGSTEIFPEGFVGEVWELYLKALKKANLSKADRKTVVEQIRTLSAFESYLFDQEGVYPEEAENLLSKKDEKRRAS